MWNVGVVVVFLLFLFTTTTASRLSDFLGGRLIWKAACCC